jgi:hypothetical protein
MRLSETVWTVSTTLVGRDAMLAAGKAGPFAMPLAPDMPDGVSALLDSIPGLDRRNALQKVRELTEATKTVTATFMGKITDSIEVADNTTQLAATKLVLEMHKLVGGDVAGPRIGSITINWSAQPNWMDHNVIDSPTNDNERVNGLQGTSTVEGTGSDPGLPTHTHSVKTESANGIDTSLKSRVKKKRGPRLPVYKGRRK